MKETQEKPTGLPENAFRPLKPGEKYEPLMSPGKTYPEVNFWSVTWGLVMAVIFSAAAAYLGLKVPFFTSNVTWSSARCSLNLPFPASPSASNSRSEGLLYSRYTLLTSSTLIANSSIQLQIPLYNTSAKCGRSFLNTVVPRNSSTAVTTQKYTVSPISSQNPI